MIVTISRSSDQMACQFSLLEDGCCAGDGYCSLVCSVVAIATVLFVPNRKEKCMIIFTSQRGEPITQEMLKAAQEVAAEYGCDVSEMQIRTVLDLGLPYSMKNILAAAKAAEIEEWIADLMLDSATAVIK